MAAAAAASWAMSASRPAATEKNLAAMERETPKAPNPVVTSVRVNAPPADPHLWQNFGALAMYVHDGKFHHFAEIRQLLHRHLALNERTYIAKRSVAHFQHASARGTNDLAQRPITKSNSACSHRNRHVHAQWEISYQKYSWLSIKRCNLELRIIRVKIWNKQNSAVVHRCC